jgi:glycosyltransferase involved in cell wall biosynthesis
MRVLFLNNFFYLRGGSEKVLFDEMKMLKDHGHSADVFARDHEQNEKAEYADYFPPKMETDRLKISPDALRVVRNLVYSKEAQNGIRQVINRFVPDIAHAHNIYGRLSVSILDALSDAGIPTVMTLHDYKIICPSYRMIVGDRICEECKGGRYYHAVVNRCHKGSFAASAVYAFESYFTDLLGKYRRNLKFLISPSEFLRRKVIDFGWDEDQVRYVPNFVHLDEFIPNYQPSDYLLYLGRLSEEKGIVTLINAFSNIRSNTIKLLIVGDGPLRGALEQRSSSDGRIQFTGYLSGDALANATRNARAVVVPSEWYENAPISILEALAYGKPVIGASIGGIPEMVEDGANGYLFTSGSQSELQGALDKLISLPASRIADMGKAGREKAERYFSPVRHYRLLLDIYQELVKGN